MVLFAVSGEIDVLCNLFSFSNSLIALVASNPYIMGIIPISFNKLIDERTQLDFHNP